MTGVVIIVRTKILKNKIRIDGRKLDQVRPIQCEVGILPRVHGSSLFTRGEGSSCNLIYEENLRQN